MDKYENGCHENCGVRVCTASTGFVVGTSGNLLRTKDTGKV
jgi:photosystem II stability/assembly factor-like uncharacterized protein